MVYWNILFANFLTIIIYFLIFFILGQKEKYAYSVHDNESEPVLKFLLIKGTSLSSCTFFLQLLHLLLILELKFSWITKDRIL